MTFPVDWPERLRTTSYSNDLLIFRSTLLQPMFESIGSILSPSLRIAAPSQPARATIACRSSSNRWTRTCFSASVLDADLASWNIRPFTAGPLIWVMRPLNSVSIKARPSTSVPSSSVANNSLEGTGPSGVSIDPSAPAKSSMAHWVMAITPSTWSPSCPIARISAAELATDGKSGSQLTSRISNTDASMWFASRSGGVGYRSRFVRSSTLTMSRYVDCTNAPSEKVRIQTPDTKPPEARISSADSASTR